MLAVISGCVCVHLSTNLSCSKRTDAVPIWTSMPITSGQCGEDADNEEDTEDAEAGATRGDEIEDEDKEGESDEGLRSGSVLAASLAR